MGYFKFLPYWICAFAAVPIIATIMVPGTVRTRMRILGRTTLLASGVAIGAILILTLSLTLPLTPGIVFAIYVTPFVCAIGAVLLVRARAPRWRDWPASRLDRFELMLYAVLVASTAVCIVLVPGPFSTVKTWVGIYPTMSKAWGIAIALLGLVAMDLLPTAPRAGFALGAVFYLAQVFGYASFAGQRDGWSLGNGVLDYRVYMGDSRYAAWIDLVASTLFVAHAFAAIRRQMRVRRRPA